MSVSVPSSFEIVQTHLALRVCAAMLLYLTTTFSFSQVHHQTDQNVKCIIIIGIEAISFQIYLFNILREIIENNFPFPPEFGRPKASIFCSRGVSGRLDALLAKSLV
jgi:hypothetical protein